jgi:hypothetical protein
MIKVNREVSPTSGARSSCSISGRLVSPCLKEIPALDHLAAALDGADFAVVAVSVDRKGIDVVRNVFAEPGMQNF